MTTQQKTIARDASFRGIGLHTGAITHLTFKPAPVNSGIQFVRTDLKGHPRISADVDHVVDVIRGTTISHGAARIHTVEHILSALHGLGIDNAEVHIDAIEPPVADGSSLPFAKALCEAGIVTQDAPRRILRLHNTIEYTSGQTFVKAEPSDNLTLDCTIIYNHPLLKEQQGRFTITPEAYVKELAACRTFCFDFEVEALKKNGLVKGGSLDNAVVVGMDRIYNKEKELRFHDEFIRHKVLDLLGDLYLLGCTLNATITAVRMGHGHNINFVKELKKQLCADRTNILEKVGD